MQGHMCVQATTAARFSILTTIDHISSMWCQCDRSVSGGVVFFFFFFFLLPYRAQSDCNVPKLNRWPTCTWRANSLNQQIAVKFSFGPNTNKKKKKKKAFTVRQIAHAAEDLHVVVKSIGYMCKHFALNALLRQHVVQVLIEHGVAVCAAIACAAAAFHNTH
jgi:hypothetical protein